MLVERTKIFFSYIKQRFVREKQAVLVFTDSDSCAIKYYLSLLEEMPNIKVVHLSDQKKDIGKKLSKIEVKKNLAVFIHGDIARLKFFFNRYAGNQNKEIDLECGWWNQLKSKKLKNGYFHSCYGSEIIAKCGDLQKTLGSWVSYNDKIVGTISEDDDIRAINKKFLSGIITSVATRKTPQSLATEITTHHLKVVSELYDDSRLSSELPGLLPDIASTIKSIRHS